MLEREPEARQRRAGGLVGDPPKKRGGENKNDPDAIISRAHSFQLLLAIASLLRDNRIGALGKSIDAEGAVILGNRRFVGAAEVLLGPSEAFGLVLQLQQANLGAGEHRADGIENRPRDASARIEVERPLEVFARLNVVHGPNTEQVTRELSLKSPEVMIEFDLAYSGLNEKRLEKAWVDLIFENPEMNQVVIRDLTFARCPRAEF